MKKVYTRFSVIAMLVMLVTLTVAGQKTIMFVGDAADVESIAYQSDIDMMDSLMAWGFLIDYWSSADISAGGLDAFYPDYDGIVISEWVGSSSVNNIGLDNYQLPVVCMEGYAVRDGRWNWITDNDNMFVQASGDAVDPQTMVITDNSHYITQIYDIDQEVDWCDPSVITATIGITSFAEDQVAYSYKLAKNKAVMGDYPDFWNLVAVDDDVLPNKVVMWGVIGTGLDNGVLDVHGGTVDFYAILHRACAWAFDEIPVGVADKVADGSFEMAVFPNPAAGRVIFRFESPGSGPAVANLYNITGQKVATFRKDAIAGRNFIEMDVDQFVPGIYHVGLELDGRTEFVKLSVQ